MPGQAGVGLTFCQIMMRMMRETIVSTTKARMAEITTTLKGRAGGSEQSRPSASRAWAYGLAGHLPPLPRPACQSRSLWLGATPLASLADTPRTLSTHPTSLPASTSFSPC